MKYMFLVCLDKSVLTESERKDCRREAAKLTRDLEKPGQNLKASTLQPVSTAAYIRVCNGKLIIMDSPFSESREQFGGFYLIDDDNLDEDIRIAAHVPMLDKGAREIRHFFEIPGLPDENTSYENQENNHEKSKL
jgi:hypothetical protein